jgi:hypothetical protein
MKPLPVNPISVTVAPLAKLLGRPFYDLPANLEVMRRLWRESVLDGFEFQHTAEWDAYGPPRDEGERRLVYWQAAAKHTVDQIAARLCEVGLPILSVHANRDVGLLLCSESAEDVARGKHLIRQSLSLCEQVGAGVCVFHLWDTWKEAFDVGFLRDALAEIAARYPGIRAAVENVPTHLAGCTPFELVKQFEWIVLDWRWAAVYDEWERFGSVVDRIADVHLHGEVREGRWALDPRWALAGRMDFDAALVEMCHGWGYGGLLTVERLPPDVSWGEYVAAIRSLRHVTSAGGT